LAVLTSFNAQFEGLAKENVHKLLAITTVKNRETSFFILTLPKNQIKFPLCRIRVEKIPTLNKNIYKI